MPEAEFLESLGIISVCAAVMVAIGRMVRMPAIVVYLLCGIVIGPWFGWVKMGEGLELVSETGIALLLFLVGLELSIGKVKDVGKVAVVAGVLQIGFTALSGYVLCSLLGFGMAEAVFLAIALTFSSTVVVVKLLDEKGELESLYGRIGLGVLLVQDLAVIMLLTFLAGMSDETGEAMNAGTVGIGLLKAFGGMAVLLVVALVASKYLLPKPFKWAARSPDVLLIWALSWCFLMVFGAHEFGLSLEVGAFLAGMSLAQLPYNEDLRRRVHPLMNLFVAVFFVTLGIRIDFSGASDHIGSVLALSTFVLLGKPLLFLAILGWRGYGRKTAFLTGVTLAQTSEFAFILAGLAMSKGLIGGNILLISALIGVVTIAVSSYTIIYSHSLYAWILRMGLLKFKFLDGKPEVADRIVHAGEHLDRHIIVVGMNSLGRELVRRLCAKGENVLAVDTDPQKMEDLPGSSLLGSVGYLSVLEEAGYSRAKLLVSALQIEQTNDLLAYRCRAAGVPCAIHVVDFSVIDNLLELETDYLMVSKVDGVKAQLRILQEMGVLK
ncbi:cation:proton antiporter [Luteolibacter algae]|uniref:Cation:proton antiporter n=1 Tax=Luteolibacter algae TaxID=454151 RepID=A0ABW5D6X2_9BACT